jgi:Ca2+/Na+ antiporter
MLRIFAFLIPGMPILGMMLFLMSLSNVNFVVYPLVIAAYLLVFLFVIFHETKKMKEADKKRKQNYEIKKAELEKRGLEVRFNMCFGFDPKYMHEPRYEKEVLIKLSFIAMKLNEYTAKMSKKNNPLNRMLYAEFLARYQRCIELLEKVRPDFVAKLPHWTELKSFVEKWSYENTQ